MSFNIAKIYAKSIYQLGLESDVKILDELQIINNLIEQNNDLKRALLCDCFITDEKEKVVDKIVSTLGLSNLVKNTLDFLIENWKMRLFSKIVYEVKKIDAKSKNILLVDVEGSEEYLDAFAEKKIREFFNDKMNKSIEINYSYNELLQAGYSIKSDNFHLEININNQFDHFRSDIEIT